MWNKKKCKAVFFFCLMYACCMHAKSRLFSFVFFQSAAIVVSFKTTTGPFVGLEVVVEITLPSEYPFKAPDVRFSCISIPASCRSLITVWSVMESTLASLQAKFLSPMFHPNVSNEGQVCKVTASPNWWYIARHAATHYLSTTRMSWVATGVLQNRLLTQWVPLKIFLLHPLQVLHL